MKTIALIGTFDSKGVEYAYVKQIIENLGLKTFTVHMGVFEPTFLPDVSNADVAKEVGVEVPCHEFVVNMVHAMEGKDKE